LTELARLPKAVGVEVENRASNWPSPVFSGSYSTPEKLSTENNAAFILLVSILLNTTAPGPYLAGPSPQSLAKGFIPGSDGNGAKPYSRSLGSHRSRAKWIVKETRVRRRGEAKVMK
jgi:hypothetical protein